MFIYRNSHYHRTLLNQVQNIRKEGRTKEFAIFQGEEIAKEKQYKFRRIISFTFLIVSIIVFLASIWFINIKVFEKSIILKIICVFSLVWIFILVVSNSLKIFPFQI